MTNCDGSGPHNRNYLSSFKEEKMDGITFEAQGGWTGYDKEGQVCELTAEQAEKLAPETYLNFRRAGIREAMTKLDKAWWGFFDWSHGR